MSSWIKRLPLWFRFTFAFLVAAAIIVVLVAIVSHNQQPLAETPAASDRAQQVQTNRLDRILVAQQQAPHRVRLATHGAPTATAAGVITAYMARQIALGHINGPLNGRASCTGASGGSGSGSGAGGSAASGASGGFGAGSAVRCSVTAGDRAEDLGVTYPFDASVDRAASLVTFCQVITSPDPSVPSPPVSAACR